MAEPDEDFSEEDYTAHLEDEIQNQYDCIAEVQKFSLVFLELLDFIGDNYGEEDNSPIQVRQQVHQDILEKYLDKCSEALSEFQEKFGSLINLED